MEQVNLRTDHLKAIFNSKIRCCSAMMEKSIAGLDIVDGQPYILIKEARFNDDQMFESAVSVSKYELNSTSLEIEKKEQITAATFFIEITTLLGLR
ncbi:hypothetical protein IM793_24260 [Pedobacter sp. MR2016-19]|uniref:hypothetical protein n=1 Tax=Pedobacter sp. MR2016-19 TaxID=2780089 RepID=UPI001873BF7C|nr:hypothetical protein [Pedobacter sp. MR2016-19]MBE5322285.1 hypothetical protein [Pedobacter sp. MR2016-19]